MFDILLVLSLSLLLCIHVYQELANLYRSQQRIKWILLIYKVLDDFFWIGSGTYDTSYSAAGHPCRGGTVTGQGFPGICTKVRGCTTV